MTIVVIWRYINKTELNWIEWSENLILGFKTIFWQSFFCLINFIYFLSFFDVFFLFNWLSLTIWLSLCFSSTWLGSQFSKLLWIQKRSWKQSFSTFHVSFNLMLQRSYSSFLFPYLLYTVRATGVWSLSQLLLRERQVRLCRWICYLKGCWQNYFVQFFTVDYAYHILAAVAQWLQWVV